MILSIKMQGNELHLQREAVATVSSSIQESQQFLLKYQ